MATYRYMILTIHKCW